MNHSEAPWRCEKNPNNERSVRNSGGAICFLPTPTHYPSQDERYKEELAERKGNAVLIAHAPEMLEFLNDLAFPKRGSGAEKWSIEDAASRALMLIQQINQFYESID